MSRRTRMANRAKALSNEKKLLALTSVVTFSSCFLPWYGINSRAINEWWNAFGSIGSVAGYIVTAFSLLTLALVLVPLAKPDADINSRLPVKESNLLVFLSTQSFFVSLIFIPVYRQYALLNASNSGTRFGIYIALVSTLAAAIISFSYQRRVERQGSLHEDFATVPRQQQNISDWERAEEEDDDEQKTEEEQEAMFESPQEFQEEPVVARTTGYENPVQDRQDDKTNDDDINLFTNGSQY